MNLPPYSFSQAFGAWHFDVWVACFVALAAVAYAWGARRAGAWPWWRTLVFVVVGLGGIVVATMSSLAVYQHTVLWAFVVQIALLMTVIPVALAAGDPVGLARANGLSDRFVRGRIGRVLTFPLVAAVLGVIVQMVLFFGPVLRPALEHAWLMSVVYLVALAVGCLLAWPLMGEDLLPEWCTPPLRMLFAALDGLLDAIPGIALVASSSAVASGYFVAHAPSWAVDAKASQQVAGTLAVAVAEVVAVPLLVVLFFQWARSELAAPDSGLDTPPAAALDRRDGSGTETPPSSAPEAATTERPWWETDPGFGRRTEEYRGRKGR